MRSMTAKLRECRQSLTAALDEATKEVPELEYCLPISPTISGPVIYISSPTSDNHPKILHYCSHCLVSHNETFRSTDTPECSGWVCLGLSLIIVYNVCSKHVMIPLVIICTPYDLDRDPDIDKNTLHCSRLKPNRWRICLEYLVSETPYNSSQYSQTYYFQYYYELNLDSDHNKLY